MGYLGCACSLGAVDGTAGVIGAPASVPPAIYLRAHLNRYTAAGGAPIEHRIAPDVLPLVDAIDNDTAIRALSVLGRRAGAAAKLYTDPATQALLRTIGQAYANPVGYVRTNLPMVIDVVRMFGDTLGLPPAVGIADPYVKKSNEKTLIAVGAVAVGLLLISSRRSKR